MVYRAKKEDLIKAHNRRKKRKQSGTDEEYLEIFAKECPKDLSDVFPWIERGTYMREDEYSKSSRFSKDKQTVYSLCSLLQTIIESAEWQQSTCPYIEPEHDYVIGIDKELYNLLKSIVEQIEEDYGFEVEKEEK